MNWPTKVLMVEPTYFDVEYAINPHMKDEEGQLKKVSASRAKTQWEKLKQSFSSLKLNVEVLPGEKGLPDMVFCANQFFPFVKDNQLNVILSEMSHENRKPEVAFFKKWAEKNQIPTHEVKSGVIEGMGDLIWNYDSEEIFAGFGYRTSPETLSFVEKLTGKKVTSFELKDERFYHLDTCLSILSGDTAAYVREAFTQEGYATLTSRFPHLIQVPLQEAAHQLACNMCTPNGEDVLIQEGATLTCDALKAFGYNVIELDTSEFLKAGGSVFCMKMLLP